MHNRELGGFALDGLNSILALPTRLMLRAGLHKSGQPKAWPLVYAVTCWDYSHHGRSDTDRRLRVQVFRVISEVEAQAAIVQWKARTPQQGTKPHEWEPHMGSDDRLRLHEDTAYALKWDPEQRRPHWRVVTDVGPDSLRRVYPHQGAEGITPSYGQYSINDDDRHPVTWWTAAENLLSPEVIAEQHLEVDALLDIGEWLDQTRSFGDEMGRFWVYANRPEFVIEKDFLATGNAPYYRADWKPLSEEVKINTPADGMPAVSGSDTGKLSGLSMTIGDVDQDTPPPNSTPTGLE